jgi:hypothetical protein
MFTQDLKSKFGCPKKEFNRKERSAAKPQPNIQHVAEG